MNLKSTFFIIIIILCGFYARSQSNYLPGYIITNTNDTINGLIDYRNDIKNSKICNYKANISSFSTEYKPFDIKAYKFDNGKYFISKNIQQKDTQTTSALFVEYLVDGIVDLYSYADLEGVHYLISKPDSSLIELTNNETIKYYGNKKLLTKSNAHIGLLKAAFNDCLELHKEINNASLTHKSLISITKSYHEYKCSDKECIIYEKKASRVELKFAPYIAINYSKLKIEEKPQSSNFEFDPIIQPAIGITIEAFFPRIRDKISLLISTEYAKQYYYGFVEINVPNKRYKDLHLNFSEQSLLLSTKYTYPKGKFRPTIAFGGGLSLILNKKVKEITEAPQANVIYTYESNDLPFPDLLFVLEGAIGCEYKFNNDRRLFLSLNFTKKQSKSDKLDLGNKIMKTVIGFKF